jgi:hypothetical protein
MKHVLFSLPLLLSVFSPAVLAQDQVERWITVRVTNVEEGILDSRQNPSFRVTADVEMVGCTRATISMTSSADVEGKSRSWVANESFSANHPGRVKKQVQILVAENSLRNPPAGTPVKFSLNARGYYTIREMQLVEYIEYVPVQRQVPGYYVPGSSGHH